MAGRELIPVLPVGMRHQINFELRGDQLAMLDDNARYIVRRMIGRAYQQGFDDGWIAGTDDYRTDRDIVRDKHSGGLES